PIFVAEAERVARARAAGVTLHAGHERLAALDRIGVEDVRAVGFLAGEVAAAGLDAREVAARGRAVVARRTCSAGSSRARARAEHVAAEPGVFRAGASAATTAVGPAASGGRGGTAGARRRSPEAARRPAERRCAGVRQALDRYGLGAGERERGAGERGAGKSWQRQRSCGR